MRKKLVILFLLACASGLLSIPALGLGQQRGGDPAQQGGRAAKKGKAGQGDVLPGQGGGALARPAQAGGKGKGDDDFDAMAAQRFKGVDKNGDGFIALDEMSAQARATGVWQKFDADGDGRLNLEEYKNFLREKTATEQGLNKAGGSNGNLYAAMMGTTEERVQKEDKVEGVEKVDWEKLPVVYRAGKLPAGLPQWFADYDLDRDGQIGLYEWKRFPVPVQQFFEMDRNGDGLLTAEEVLWHMNRTASSGSQNLTTASYSPGLQNMQGFQNGSLGGYSSKGQGGGRKGW